jgi:hypothetical protein
MPPEADSSDSANLSVEDASALLDLNDEETPAVVPKAPAAAAAEPTTNTESEGATSTPEDAPPEAATQTEEGEEGQTEETPAAAPAEPPAYWSQDAKAKFLELTPELQAVVLAQEGPREAAAAKAKDEAAQVRAAADKELAGVTKFAEELQKFLPQAVQTFRSRWGDNPDWAAFAQTHGTEAMTLAKVQYEQERGQLQQVAEAAKVAEAQALKTYVQTEFQTLAKIAPELVDPKAGLAKRGEVSKYLEGQGIPGAQIQRISAVEMVLARKAMLWDQAQAKAAPKPAPKPAPATTTPLARGAAAAGSADPKTKQAQTASNRFHKSGSIGDAVSLLNALDD